MNSKVLAVIETYKRFIKIPTPLSAVILPGITENVFSVQSTWAAHDLKKSEKNSYIRQYLGLPKCEGFEFIPGIATDSTSRSLTAFSKSGNKCAVLLRKEKSSEEHQYLEIWSSTRKENTFDMHNRKEHGKICENAQFASFEWSVNEKYLLYVAEMKQPKSESYFCDTPVQTTDDKPSEGATKGEEFVYREDWGEQLVGVHHPIICILDTETGVVEALTATELENISAGQAVWGPDDDKIIFVGTREYPRRLGSTFCTNRRSAIYSINVKSKTVDCISGDHEISVRSPRCSPDYSYLVYIENKSGGPHHTGSQLIKYDWATGTRSVLVDYINNAPADQFPGLYIVGSLPGRCFSEDGNYVYLSSYWRSRLVILCVDIKNSSVEQIHLDNSFGICDVLDVKNDIIVVAASSPDTEPCLIAGKFHKQKNLPVSWTYLDVNAPTKIAGINWSIEALKPTNVNEQYPNIDYEIVMITPEGKEKDVPLILWPHGGPHAVFHLGYSAYAASFVKLGYALCFVNFRGSIGFGEDSINSLLKNVGDQDVKDVHNAAEYMKKNCGLSISETILFGGSHGGFLVAHLSGQYPDYYKAAILRNPVINISALSELSDIPDWAWVETGQGDLFDFSSHVTPDVLSNMWKQSPIKYINNVTLPTLLLLGKNDLRVPPVQGLTYYHLLKAKKVPVSVYCYDDCHSLMKTSSTSDGFMQICLWLMKHLDTK